MATAEITVLPIGREGASVGDVITDIRQRLEAQDRVAFRMGGMGTELEGDIEDILAICAQLHAVPLQSGFPRAYTVIKVDQRIDREQSLSDKIDSVERRL
ncbi:MAG TPA: MTH1187 family thiamine-binding protein [Solirubrobacterales bacterium]|nr:MTH1187 family thiamine-binding protein [Solirubrobacterales bacterium]